ncbi:hypothetical protein A2U01_0019986, partial [Trifolium medium]|nr:hypothetical protein [Trifolium medium]
EGKKDKKRKSSGIKIDEGRSKLKHDKRSKIDESSTESDEETLAQRLKQKSSEAYAKEMHKKFSKGKFSESSKFAPLEAQVPGFDIPVTTIILETQPINVSSSTSPDTAELDKEAETIIKEGITKFGETPKSDVVAEHLFQDKQVPDLRFLEEHLSPNPIAEQTFTHDQNQQEQQHQQQNETQPEPQSQPEPQPTQPEPQPQPQSQPEQGQTQPEPIITPNILNQIKIIQRAIPPETLKPTFSHPYQFITNSEPNNELLQLQIYEDFKNLSDLRNDLFKFPSDVTAGGEVLKAKFAHAVDNFVKIVQEKMIEERGIIGLNRMKEMFERCKRKRLTLTPHYDPRVEEMVVNEVLS